MTSVTEGSRLLTPTLLGRDGVLRAFPLLGSDRGDLSLEDWLDEYVRHVTEHIGYMRENLEAWRTAEKE